MTKVLVCGGRNYTNKGVVFRFLDDFHAKRPINQLIEGDCRGADRLAGEWAVSRGVPLRTFPVTPGEWDTLGKAAGNIRNQRMLDQGFPNVIIAFPGNNGTADMCRRARRKRLEVIEVKPQEQQMGISEREKEMARLLDLINMEWKTDPMSVACFDLRIIADVRKVLAEHEKAQLIR